MAKKKSKPATKQKNSGKSVKPKTIKKKTVVSKLKSVKKSVTKDITEIVYDYATACKYLKRKALLPDVSMLPEKHQKAFLAFIILTTIFEAWNQGWEPDFTNGKWDKYYVWVGVMKDPKHPSGFGFSNALYLNTYSTTTVGSRLYLKESRLALRAGEKFPELLKDFYFIPKKAKIAIKVKKLK